MRKKRYLRSLLLVGSIITVSFSALHLTNASIVCPAAENLALAACEAAADEALEAAQLATQVALAAARDYYLGQLNSLPPESTQEDIDAIVAAFNAVVDGILAAFNAVVAAIQAAYDACVAAAQLICP